jgi:hypothetical protein
MFPAAGPGHTRGTTDEENAMTEQQNTPGRPSDDEGTRASAGNDAERPGVERPGGGRTAGETAVDDALGQDNPPE